MILARISIEERARVQTRLLEAAAEVFAETGLEAAGIDQISLRAGFAKGTIYNYFESKDRLFEEVLAEGARRVVARVAPAEAPGGSARERLHRLAEADVAVARESEAFFRVVIREAMSFRPKGYAAVVEGLAPFLVAVTAAIEHGMSTGEVRDDRPSGQLALAFVGILSLGLVQHWGSDGVWPAFDDIAELTVTTFLDGAAPRG